MKNIILKEQNSKKIKYLPVSSFKLINSVYVDSRDFQTDWLIINISAMFSYIPSMLIMVVSKLSHI